VPRIEGKLEITNSISELRAKAGITQQQLADEIEVTRATVLAMEKGNYNPSLELAFRISLYFNVSITSIFTVKGKAK
jgi:putative transcriptional regulator